MFQSEWREFPSAPCPCRKRNLMTARVSMLLKSRASLTCFQASFLPGRTKDLSAPRVPKPFSAVLKIDIIYLTFIGPCVVIYFIIKPTRCTNVSNYLITKRHSTCFGRSFRPSSGVQDCTYSNPTDTAICLLASRQQYLFDKCLLFYIQSRTPDD